MMKFLIENGADPSVVGREAVHPLDKIAHLSIFNWVTLDELRKALSDSLLSLLYPETRDLEKSEEKFDLTGYCVEDSEIFAYQQAVNQAHSGSDVIYGDSPADSPSVGCCQKCERTGSIQLLGGTSPNSNFQQGWFTI
jgi:hypothetical protein